MNCSLFTHINRGYRGLGVLIVRQTFYIDNLLEVISILLPVVQLGFSVPLFLWCYMIWSTVYIDNSTLYK